jgi:hypothetical protein
MVVGFPALWALGLLPAAGSRHRRAVFAIGAATACWLSFLLVWRLLPWTFITAWAG